MFNKKLKKIGFTKKRAYSLAVAIMVIVFTGMMAALTIPDAMRIAKKKRAKFAYNVGVLKVQDGIVGQIISTEKADYKLRQEGDKEKKILGRVDEAKSAKDTQKNMHERIDYGYAYKDGKRSQESAEKIWKGISESVYAQGFSCASPTSTQRIDGKNLKTKATWGKTQSGTGTGSYNCGTSGDWSPWVVIETGVAIAVNSLSSQSEKDCGTISEINSQTSIKDSIKKSCALIIIDTNGLMRGPNKIVDENQEFNKDTDMNKVLQSDRLRFYIGKDGVTTGSKTATETGQLKTKCSPGFVPNPNEKENGCLFCNEGYACVDGKNTDKSKVECISQKGEFSTNGNGKCQKCEDYVKDCIKCANVTGNKLGVTPECSGCGSNLVLSIKGDMCCKKQTGCKDYITHDCLCRDCLGGYVETVETKDSVATPNTYKKRLDDWDKIVCCKERKGCQDYKIVNDDICVCSKCKAGYVPQTTKEPTSGVSNLVCCKERVGCSSYKVLDDNTCVCTGCKSGFVPRNATDSVSGQPNVVCCASRTGCSSYTVIDDNTCKCDGCTSSYIQRGRSESVAGHSSAVCCSVGTHCTLYSSSCGSCSSCWGSYWYPSGSGCYYDPPPPPPPPKEEKDKDKSNK